MSCVGSTAGPSYGVTIVATRGSLRSSASASSTAARNSGVFALGESLEKMSVKVDPPERGSSRSMSCEARPDSDVEISPPDCSFPPPAATAMEASSTIPETARTHQRRR